MALAYGKEEIRAIIKNSFFPTFKFELKFNFILKKGPY